MIPRIIHQVWKTDTVPEHLREWSRSWSEKNPGWRHILWSDRMLLDFVARHYPRMLSVYCNYPQAVMRADAARYMLLHHFGGVYADLDAECLASLELLTGEDRVVLCHEPPSHWRMYMPSRGLTHVLFNGTMASPAGHPFWPHLIEALPTVAQSSHVLDATGPLLLTGLVGSYPDQAAIAIHSCHLFNAFDKAGIEAPAYAGSKPVSLARHHWNGSWVHVRRRRPIRDGLRKSYYRARHWLTRGERLDPAAARAAVDPAVLRSGPPAGDSIAVLVPVRDAADHIAPFLQTIATLDHPSDRIKLVFCEGDSQDGTYERLVELTAPLRDRYRDIVLLRHDVDTFVPRARRWLRKYQRARRSGLARVRNHLIDHGLDAGDDWALWIDVDVWRFPRDILRQLRNSEARIVTPNCVIEPGGPSFDRNAFVITADDRDWIYYRDLKDGLYQPRDSVCRRLYLSELRYLDRVPLDAVGGAMLLVDASLHRGGLRFPEWPYRDLVETEGFGALARDLGVTPIGLPKVEILHVPW
jgi:GT2 family glycosyltransferase